MNRKIHLNTTHRSLLTILTNHQQLLATFGLAFQRMITVQGHLIVLLLPPHLVRVHLAPMPLCLAQPTQQRTHLSIPIPFSIVLRDLALVLLEMVLAAIVLLRIAHCIISLRGEALQRQSHHRVPPVRRLECGHFILRVVNRKLQKVESL